MTSTFSNSARPALARLVSLCAGVAAMAALAHGAASAQGRLEAQYEATLAGVPVGKGAWNIDIGDDQYSASAFGGTSGILKAFASGSGTGAAQGRVVNGALVATNYSASTTTSKKSEAIHITLVNGNVKEFGIVPEPPVDPDRLPVTDAHRKCVYGPMTASCCGCPGTADPLTPDACRALPPFSTAACATISSSTSSAWKQWASTAMAAGRGLRDLFHPGRRLHPRPPRRCRSLGEDQRQHRDRLRAGRRHPHPGAVLDEIPTPLGHAMLEATDFS